MAFVVDKESGKNSMVTDHERKITLKNKPPSPEIPHCLELTVEGKTINMEVEDDTRALGLPKRDVVWRIRRVQMPVEWQNRSNEIAALVTEALETYGSYGSWEKVNTVTVDFSQTKWV